MLEPEKTKWKEYADKHLAIMQLFNQWLMTKQEGKTLEDYLKREEINTVAIYGMSYVGERLYDELKTSGISVKYAIDKNAEGIYSEIDIVQPEEELEKVDAIIVTAIYYYDEIAEMLEKKTDARILSLEDVLYDL